MFFLNENVPKLIEDFHLPFGGKLNPQNRWVQLAQVIPWALVEEKYVEAFRSPVAGQKAYSVRVALGSLIIKERLGLSDRETTQQIMENPYLQFFIGLSEFVDEEPFHHSLLTHFRERLGADILAEVNEHIALEAAKAEEAMADEDDDDQDDDPDDGQLTMDVGEALSIPAVESKRTISKKVKTSKVLDSASIAPENKGTLILDATCTPADIKYPTDLGLLNHAREILESIIDTLHEPHIGYRDKPRTYRTQARKDYLRVSKQRKAKGKVIRKAIKKQLSYVGRDLKTIEKQIEHTSLTALSKRQYRSLLVISELYTQQREMYEKKKHSVPDRIVSIEQPHVRPIVRGKAGSQVEFGAKLAASMVDGYAYIESLQWDNFNEATTLQRSVESYNRRFGFYPSVILADKIYRNRDNLAYCKEHGIRFVARNSADHQRKADMKIRNRSDKMQLKETP